MSADNAKVIFFREADPYDIERMTEVDRICFSVPWSRNDFVKELTENQIALYIVAEHDGQVIGYAGLWCILDEGHITNVAVHPDYRRNGIGKELVEKLMDYADAGYGIVSFTLEVRASNDVGISLYESIGFKEAGRRKAYYSDNKEDAIIMWLVGKS